MKLRQRSEMKKTKIEIIPMIDTMFFLLVFFILASVNVIKLEGLNVNLPKAASGGQTGPTELTISIDAGRNIQVGKTRVAPGSDIGPAILKELGVDPNDPNRTTKLADRTVVISADEGVPHGLVVQCIDQARLVDVSRFAIATTQPEDRQPAPTR
jgi:biopolymer transport protein ExbD